MSVCDRINKWILPVPESVKRDALETEEEYRERWTSIRIIYFTMFLMSLGFSIILTGVWPYLDKLEPSAGKEFMGYVVAANPFAQMLFSPLFGWWSNRCKSVRVPLVTSLCTFGVANAVYSSLELFPVHRKYWMLGSRLLVGVSSANVAVCRAYLSAATRVSERTQAVSMVSLAQVLGFVVGPALQACVVPLGAGAEAPWLWPGRLRFDMYTAAGWINALLGVANAALFLARPFDTARALVSSRVAAREAMRAHGADDERQLFEKDGGPDRVAAWTLIVAFFVLVFNFMLLETLCTSLTMDQFAWTKREALRYMGALMSVGAVVACVTFLAVRPVCRRFAERRVMLWAGFFLMAVGRAVYVPLGGLAPPAASYDDSLAAADDGNATSVERVGCPAASQPWCLDTPAMTLEQFLLGYALTALGYPVGVTLVQTIFSKCLGPRPQGVWMGLLTGAGCLSRVLGPVTVTYVYTRYGPVHTFAGTAVMMLAAMLWLWLLLDRLDVTAPRAPPPPPLPPDALPIDAIKLSQLTGSSVDVGVDTDDT